MASDAGVGLISGMFSTSATYKTMTESITNRSMYISDVSSFVSTAQAETVPGELLGLGQVANLLIGQLTVDFKDDPEAYYDVIAYIGTHYFAKGKFGGYIRNVFTTSRTYYLSHTEDQLEAQAQGSFFNLLKVDGGYSGSTFEVDEQFSSNTVTSILYYGGDTNLLEEDGLPAWQPTVQGNPWIFAGTLKPISVMIMNATKSDQWDLAVQAHLDRAFLNELQSMLISALNRYQWGNTSYIASLLDQDNQKRL